MNAIVAIVCQVLVCSALASALKVALVQDSMFNDQPLTSQRSEARGRRPPQAPAIQAQAAPQLDRADAEASRRQLVWGRGVGLLVALSLGLHGLLLALPLPQSTQPDPGEDLATDDNTPEVLISITALPPPALDEPIAVEVAPLVEAPPAPTAAAPAAPAPVTAPPAVLLEPIPSPESVVEPAPETAAFTPPPGAVAPNGEALGNILGIPLLPGSQEIASPVEALRGDRLALHQRNGATHPDIEGQFLVPVTESDPETWFATVYRPVLTKAYSVRNEGAFATAPKYSLTRDSYDRFAFITVEWVADYGQMLVTVWRRNPV